MRDTCHSRQLVLKACLAGDEEIETTQRLLVTGTAPEPSVANFLANSPRFATRFQEVEKDECLAVLRHLGWSPQRFDSRSKPLGRIATRLGVIFETLAYEADHASSAGQKQWARRLLTELGSYERLLLAGLLADLSSEHRKWVRESDVQDPSAEGVLPADLRFQARLRALFLKGGILSAECTESFTAQVIAFMKKKQTLHYGKQVKRCGCSPSFVCVCLCVCVFLCVCVWLCVYMCPVSLALSLCLPLSPPLCVPACVCV